ncbi:MAG: metalloregulator ArsR/SmtB family transcription factor [Hyphomicrobiaceae bacterium]|nr:metalloregulator ArsR/SmtB family transcription factor [Hyphomicrobiaceae bacterium]
MTDSMSKAIEDVLGADNEISEDLASLMRKARKASDFLKALAHENRLVILCLLSERERSVTELEGLLALSQATVSQQLARLRHEGLVETRREGRAIYYSLADDTTRRFIRAIYDKFCREG